MFRPRRVLALALVTLALGCEHKEKAANNAAPPPGMPPLTEGANAAAPPINPEHPPAMPPDHPGMGGAEGAMPGAMPPGHPAINPQGSTPGGIEFDPKTVIAGVLRLDDKVKSKVKEGDVIFLSARTYEASGAPGSILAVKKMTAAKWPMQFQLDGRDAMMTGTTLSGKVVITVRVDKDGDAMTKNPGDVTGVSRALDVPSDKVVLTLDTLL
jgi:hypothetical protein